MWLFLFLQDIQQYTCKFPFVISRITLNFWGFGRKWSIECALRREEQGNAEFLTDVGKVGF
jgi:hypothetical protein